MEAETRQKNPFLFPLEGSVIFVYLIQVLILLAGIVKIRINSISSVIILTVAFIPAITHFIIKSKQNRGTTSDHPQTWAYRIALLLIAGIAALYILLWFLAIVSPDLSWDGNAYHIPPISMWATHGNVYWIESPYLESIINGYPKGAEVVAYGMAMAFGNSTVNTVNLAFLPLGVLGIASLACSLGTRPFLSLLAGMLFILVPVNINQAATTYVDSAFASSVIALTALWLNAILTEPIKKWGWAIPFGASIGLAISIKSTGIALSGISLIILFFLMGKKLLPGKSSKEKTNFLYWKNFILAFFLIGVIASIGGGYWYIRNYAHTGSPLYPVGLSVFGRTIFPGISVANAISETSNTPEKIIGLPAIFKVLYTWLQDLTKWPTSIKGYDSRLAGMGFLWIIGCVPSIVVFTISHLKKHTLASTGFVPLSLLIAIAFVLTPMNWWARYILWVYALGLPAFAWILEVFIVNRPTRHVGTFFAGAWLSICILLSLFEGLYCTMDALALATPESFGNTPLSIFRSETWAWPTSYLFPEMSGTAIEEVLLNGKVVGMGPHGDSDFTQYTGLVGQLSQPIGTRQLIFLDENTSIEEIQALGIDSIIWDASIPLPQSLTSLLQEDSAGFIILKNP